MVTRKSWVLVTLLVGSCQCFGQTCSPTSGQTSPLPATPVVQNVAHITTGGGFITKFTIVNLSATANTIVFNDISQAGSLTNSQTCTIPGNGTLRLTEGVATSASETHWALVGSQTPVGVNLFFEFSPSGSVANTVGFNDVPAKTSYIFPVEFEPTPPGASIGSPQMSQTGPKRFRQNPNNTGPIQTIPFKPSHNFNNEFIPKNAQCHAYVRIDVMH